jgi:hypothetical protein
MVELKGKLVGIAKMLPRATRVERSPLSIGGKALTFLFGAALSEDISAVNDKIDALKAQQGNLVHDADRQLTVSRELDNKIKGNAKTIAQMKLPGGEARQNQIKFFGMINATEIQLENEESKASYIREAELILSRIYTDLTELSLSLDLTLLNR